MNVESKFVPFRHTLAALHFNENVRREKRTTKDGNIYYNVIYPKFKLGEEVVREVAVPPTYGISLIHNTFFCVTA